MRARTPLFAKANGSAYTYSELNGWLHALMVALAGAGVASTLSWHSFRIELACRLRAAKCPDEVIQLICRWKCRESLQKYAQIGCDDNVEWIRRAHAQRFEAYRTTNLVQLDNSAELCELAGTPARRSRPVETVAVAAGTRVRVLWGEEWWPATCGASKRGESSRDSDVLLHHIKYDAVGSWPPTDYWHDLAEETWHRVI